MFVLILVRNPPSNPMKLLQDNFEILSDDCKHKLQVGQIIKNPSEADITDYLMFLLQKELSSHNTNFTQAGINLKVPDCGRFQTNNQVQSSSCAISQDYNCNILTIQQAKVLNRFMNAL
ncbi:hypothetical protein O181_007024 [Austropuccinia psidii MF-1]|uniref:Uncharacterized protein n=1 Tax=Austropuccinia psidii MF-1 TaxID=1389203 RepID=A0A9Q3BK70_9BASI|nr:hypothetical protein [Austropuccinia psidii MF-1]